MRKGDTLASIAKKRNLEFTELVKLNHDVSPGPLQPRPCLPLPIRGLFAAPMVKSNALPIAVGQIVRDCKSFIRRAMRSI